LTRSCRQLSATGICGYYSASPNLFILQIL
jgi:hypothetical protein